MTLRCHVVNVQQMATNSNVTAQFPAFTAGAI